MIENEVKVGQLLDLLERDYRIKRRRSAGTLHYQLRPLRRALGDLAAATLDWNVIEGYKEARIAEGKAPKTVNNELGYLARAYVLGRRAGLASIDPPIEKLPGARVRTGYVEPQDFGALYQALPEPIDDLAAWAYITGWRRGECLAFRWDWIEGARIVLPGERSKNGHARVVLVAPGSRQKEILERRLARKDGSLVFHREGKPIVTFRCAWRTAARRIGLPGLLFHDLRRSAARNLINAGVPELTAQAYLGHRTASMFKRYAIRDEADIAAAGARLEAFILGRLSPDGSTAPPA